MNYQDALEYLIDKSNLGSRLGLDAIGKLLELLGNPQDKLRFIHVGGTNGKGSTSTYLAFALEAAGYKVGLFTSPHLERYNESIQINHREIPNEKMGRLIGIIREKADIMVEKGLLHPTTFEIITALGFLYFLEEKVDYVVLEVGLGGRNDSTNIIDSPLATVFTPIDYDHIDILGNTLSEIAYEKAGIIKENTAVISYIQDEEVSRVIKEVSEEKEAELYICPVNNIKVKRVSNSGARFDFSYKGSFLEDIEIFILGEYQIYNAALALTTILILKNKGYIDISEEQLKEGFSRARIPGRLEILRENPTFIVDGAHNVQSVIQLKNSIRLFKYNKLILGIGMLKDKDTAHVAQLLAPLAQEIVVTEVNSPRKLEANTLAEKILDYNESIQVEKDVKKAIERALEIAEKDDLIIFTGSLYLIGEVRSLIKLL